MGNQVEIDLKEAPEKLDNIDKNFYDVAFNGYYEGKLASLVGMWEKGRAIGEFRGVDSPIVYINIKILSMEFK